MKYYLKLFILVIIPGLLLSFQDEWHVIKGRVTDGQDPIDSARVRIQGENEFVYSDSAGHFTIYTGEPQGRFLSISAGKQGWYNKDRTTQVGDTTLQIPLVKLPDGDDMSYEFNGPDYCNTCHEPIYKQWIESKHANAAKNPMVLQLLNGTDAFGNDNVAPGFKLDNPFNGGDCADCHAPSAAQWNPGDTDLNDVLWLGEVDTNGVFCDFCHKISDVRVNYGRGINGSITLKRPSAEYPTDINFGPLDDVTTFWMGATYSPIHTKSALCSGCHQYANETGIVVDDTYDSWLASTYADSGIQCQDCHMKPFTDSIFVSGIGIVDAIERDPKRLYNHYFRKFGTTDSSQTASMDVNYSFSSDTLTIDINVTNQKAGHNLPTGVSLRNIILVVKVENKDAFWRQVSGDTLPHFAGSGDVENGNYSGMPGKAFALVTYDASRNEWPSGNWAATGIYMDTRIAAGATDSSSYKLYVKPGNGLTVKVELLYRAVYKHWADVKSWDTREYVMADTVLNIIPTAVQDDRYKATAFVLQQNYPNPFNPATTIDYTLPAAGNVQLTIFDISGREVKTLVQRRQPAGTYSVSFNAGGMPSGIYIYRLTTSYGLKHSRKMILIK